MAVLFYVARRVVSVRAAGVVSAVQALWSVFPAPRASLCARQIRATRPRTMAQVLRYEPGELYGRHHDAMDGQGRDPAGPRLFTVLLYLSEVNVAATPLPIHPNPNPFRHPPRPAARPEAPPGRVQIRRRWRVAAARASPTSTRR